ncbi:MAG: YceD family protein [Candidatus Margulisiibacteriota bacterium]
MKIDLTELLHKVGNEVDLEQEEEVTFPEDNLNLTKPVKISVHLVNIDPSVLLYGKAETEVELECSRCLKKYKYPVLIELNEEFTKDPFIPKKSKERELKAEDFASPIEKDNTIDLTEFIRQDLSLEMPIKTLCSEDCKGIKGE